MSGGITNKAARCLGLVMLAIGTVVVSVSVAADAPGPAGPLSEPMGVSNFDAGSTAGELGGCRIALVSAAADADGMPRLNAELPSKKVQPQPGGSVLVNATLRFHNASGLERNLKLDGIVRDATLAEHAVNWRDAATGQEWSGRIREGQEETVVFYAQVSAPIPGPVTLLLHVTDESGQALWLQSAQLPVIVAR